MRLLALNGKQQLFTFVVPRFSVFQTLVLVGLFRDVRMPYRLAVE